MRQGFDKVGPHTEFLSNIIKMSDVRGETARRGRAMRNAALDWDTATTNAAPITRRRGCGGASQVAVGGVYG